MVTRFHQKLQQLIESLRPEEESFTSNILNSTLKILAQSAQQIDTLFLHR